MCRAAEESLSLTEYCPLVASPKSPILTVGLQLAEKIRCSSKVHLVARLRDEDRNMVTKAMSRSILRKRTIRCSVNEDIFGF